MIDICDGAATRCCTSTISLLYHMEHGKYNISRNTSKKAFFRFCQPNWNYQKIKQSRLQGRGPKSMFNAITQRTGISNNNPPTFDTKYSVILYAVTDEPENAVPIYTSTKVYEERQYTTSSYGRALTKEDMQDFINLVGLQTESVDPLTVFQHFTQKYNQLQTPEQWKALAKQVKYKIPSKERMTIQRFRYEIAKHIQARTKLRTGFSNGQHRTAFTAVVTEGWDKLQEVCYETNELELMAPKEKYIRTPENSILHQPITMTLWCPKSDCFDADLVRQIYYNSKREILEGKKAKDLDLQEVMSIIINKIEERPDLWNWEKMDYFGNTKMFPEGYRKLIPMVAKELFSHSPALYDVLDYLRTKDTKLRQELYNNPNRMDEFLEKYVWSNVHIMGIRGLQAMNQNKYHSEFPLQMFPTIREDYDEISPNFRWGNYFHFIRVFLLALQNDKTLTTLKKITNGKEDIPHTVAEPRQYVSSKDFWNNKTLVVYFSVNVVKCARIFGNFMYVATQRENKQDITIPTYSEAKKGFVINAVVYNMAADLMEIIEEEGINPKKNVPEPNLFPQEEIAQYGYFGIFLKYLPLYAEKIWNTATMNYDYLATPLEVETQKIKWKAKSETGKYQNSMRYYCNHPKVYDDGSFKLTNSPVLQRKKLTSQQRDCEEWKKGQERHCLTNFGYRPTLRHIWHAMYSTTPKFKRLRNLLKEVDKEIMYPTEGQVPCDNFAKKLKKRTTELTTEKKQLQTTISTETTNQQRQTIITTDISDKKDSNRTTVANPEIKRKKHPTPHTKKKKTKQDVQQQNEKALEMMSEICEQNKTLLRIHSVLQTQILPSTQATKKNVDRIRSQYLQTQNRKQRQYTKREMIQITKYAFNNLQQTEKDIQNLQTYLSDYLYNDDVAYFKNKTRNKHCNGEQTDKVLLEEDNEHKQISETEGQTDNSTQTEEEWSE